MDNLYGLCKGGQMACINRRLLREPLAQLLRRVVFRAGDRFMRQYFFDPVVQDRLGREQFFFNAFKALSFNGISGDYVEFGSGWGRTLALAYKESTRHCHPADLWTFDSFKGLPPPEGTQDEHPRWREGQFATSLDEFHASCAAQGVPREAYTVVPGFFADTLTSMSPTDPPQDVALAYVDCDLYSSTKTVLDFLAPRLKHGMILALDDYFNWGPAQIAGERRALVEFLGSGTHWDLLPYLTIGWHGMSFVVEDRHVL
jgi:O-methyltransferase